MSCQEDGPSLVGSTSVAKSLQALQPHPRADGSSRKTAGESQAAAEGQPETWHRRVHSPSAECERDGTAINLPFPVGLELTGSSWSGITSLTDPSASLRCRIKRRRHRRPALPAQTVEAGAGAIVDHPASFESGSGRALRLLGEVAALARVDARRGGAEG